MREKQKLILAVSEMQMESIRHLFLHSNWEFQPLIESSQEGEFGAKRVKRIHSHHLVPGTQNYEKTNINDFG